MPLVLMAFLPLRLRRSSYSTINEPISISRFHLQGARVSVDHRGNLLDKDEASAKGGVPSACKVFGRMPLRALRILAGAVFVGWLMIWVVMPTNTYRNHWAPKLRSATDSTYFGRQGTNFLIYTFPILFIFVVGCIYLHLLNRYGSSIKSGSLNRPLVAWKKPALIDWPLGVVSRLELSFCLMFLALLVWFYSTYLRVGFANLDQSPGEKLWQSRLDSAAVRLALLGDLCCAFLFFPVARGSSLLPLVGLTSESAIKYHIWLGHIVMTIFSAHGLCYVVYWASTKQLDQMLKWAKTDVAYLAGEIALVSGWIMWSTTFPRIRRKMFELFFYTHHLYAVFLFFYLMHVGINHFCMILPGVYLFMLDRYLRFLQSRTRTRLVSARLLPSEAVELNFSKSPELSYNPLSTVFINASSVSSMQWHPFTVCSSSSLEPERLSVIIKKEGSWTQKLYTVLSSPIAQDRLDVSVEGPYGPSSMNFLRYDSLVLISGGSGITPFISLIRELMYRSTILNSPTPPVLLICAFRNSADLTMLDLLLPISGNFSDFSGLNLRVEAFVTREKIPSDNAEKLIRTIWFKPKRSDMPIAPIFGTQNGWLWMAAIVSSSFVTFLVLIGLLQRYYIYPIDHNTNSIYPYSARSAFNFLFICISITITASAVVLWNKRRRSKEAKQIQNLDAPSPTVSPSSWFYNADIEAESVLHESLVKATNVHYGGRPDIKRILLDYHGGTNTGVMASGPRGMRHEVAEICSSGSADNLHFESISFSW